MILYLASSTAVLIGVISMLDLIFDIGLLHYLILALLMFILGIAGIMISRNLLRIVMSMLVVSLSIILNFAAFGTYCDDTLANSNLVCVFVILLAFVQVSIGLAVFYKIYRSNEYLDIEKIKDREG